MFLSLNAADPYDCTRALFSLKECKFAGRVQLFGKCEPAFLESFRKIGNDVALAMLPVLQKPVDAGAIRKIVQEQKLNTETVSPPDLSLKKAIASNWISFVYQPQVDLKKKMVIGAEAFVRVTHPQHGVRRRRAFSVAPARKISNGLAAQASPARSEQRGVLQCRGAAEVRHQYQRGNVGQASGGHPGGEIPTAG